MMEMVFKWRRVGRGGGGDDSGGGVGDGQTPLGGDAGEASNMAGPADGGQGPHRRADRDAR